MPRKKHKIVWFVIAVIFILMNISANFHAYKFTHFTSRKVDKTAEAGELKGWKKIRPLLFGINNPRPENYKKPAGEYQSVWIQSNKKLGAWFIQHDSAVGTVILFHGYSGEKSGMLDKAKIFQNIDYNVLLVDFMGAGTSEGNQTTIGYREAEQVAACYEYVKKKGDRNIILSGTSMGAVAIIKAIHSFDIEPSAIIVECPYSTMYRTVCNRFTEMNVPTFPMAGLLTFWGGIQNGYWAFAMKPVKFAKSVKCPTLLLYGGTDSKVHKDETKAIYDNFSGPKELVIYCDVGHANYLEKSRELWISDVTDFLSSYAAKESTVTE